MHLLSQNVFYVNTVVWIYHDTNTRQPIFLIMKKTYIPYITLPLLRIFKGDDESKLK